MLTDICFSIMASAYEGHFDNLECEYAFKQRTQSSTQNNLSKQSNKQSEQLFNI